LFLEERTRGASIYPQELQDVLLHEVQPDVPASGFSVPVAQKTENCFFTFPVPHFGQVTSWFPKTSFSKSFPH
jgi:hypothetical protein